MTKCSNSEVFVVSGGAGFIGSAFVRQMSVRGNRVVVLDKFTYAGHRSNIEGLGGVEILEGDISDTRHMLELIKRVSPQAWVNFAAESHVDRSIDAPSTFIQ